MKNLDEGLELLDRFLNFFKELMKERIEGASKGLVSSRTLANDIFLLVKVLREVTNLQKDLNMNLETKGLDISVLKSMLMVFLRQLKDDLIKRFGVKSTDAVTFIEEKKQFLEQKISELIR